jgi:hypothetical protein
LYSRSHSLGARVAGMKRFRYTTPEILDVLLSPKSNTQRNFVLLFSSNCWKVLRQYHLIFILTFLKKQQLEEQDMFGWASVNITYCVTSLYKTTKKGGKYYYYACRHFE